MADRGRTADVDWNKRAAFWSKAAPKGLSTNDAPNQLLIRMARIDEGHHVLDLASGAGEPAISIAVHVGASGHVTAMDNSQGMLDGLMARAGNLGLENVTPALGSLDDLPFEDDKFDAVTCRFGLMFAADGAATLRDIRRVLKPGGRAALMVHGPPDKNAMYTTVRAAVLDYFGEPDDGHAMRRFKFSGEGELAGLLEAAGFQDVEAEFVSEIQKRPVGEVFWDALLMRAFGARVSALSEAERAELDRQITGAFEPFRNGDRYELISSEQVAAGAP